jgi:hypothetical protein
MKSTPRGSSFSPSGERSPKHEPRRVEIARPGASGRDFSGEESRKELFSGLFRSFDDLPSFKDLTSSFKEEEDQAGNSADQEEPIAEVKMRSNRKPEFNDFIGPLGVAVLVIACITELQVLIFRFPKGFYDKLLLSNVIFGFICFFAGRSSKNSEEEEF